MRAMVQPQQEARRAAGLPAFWVGRRGPGQAQREVLAELGARPHQTHAELRCDARTLYRLEDRGLVKRRPSTRRYAPYE